MAVVAVGVGAAVAVVDDAVENGDEPNNDQTVPLIEKIAFKCEVEQDFFSRTSLFKIDSTPEKSLDDL